MSWPTVSFSNVAKDVTGGNIKTLQSDFLEAGQFPIVDQGKGLIAGFTDDENRLCRIAGPVIVFGDHTKAIKYIDFPFCLGADGTKILRPEPSVDPRYLFHALHQIHIPEAGYSRHFKYLKEGTIPFPPLPEQRRIARILDQADALRRLRRQSLSRLSDLGQAVFDQMFGDTSQDNSLAFNATVGDVCQVSSGATPSRKIDGYYGGTIPWVKTTEVKGGAISRVEEYLTEAGRAAARLKTYPPKTILVAMYGQGRTRGNVGYLTFPATVNQACAALQCNEKCLPEFLFYQLKISYERLRRLGQGGNQPNLNGEIVRSFPIVLPTISRQNAFLKAFEGIRDVENQMISHVSQLDSLFSALQHRAFRGEI